MAYREQITNRDLEHGGRLLRAIQQPNLYDIAVKEGFSALHSCAYLLFDIVRDLRDTNAKWLTFRRWGPAYSQWLDDDGVLTAHAVGWELWRRRNNRELGFGCCVSFGAMGKTRTTLTVYTKPFNEKRCLDEPIRRFFSHGHLDADTILSTVRKQATKWNIE